MANHEINGNKREIPPQVVLGIGAAAAITGVHLAYDKMGFDEEAANNWSPPPTEQESLESTSTIDRYGLDVGADGVINVYQELLNSADGADSLTEPEVATVNEESVGEGEYYPAEVAEPGEGSPKIEPLQPGDYAKDPN